MNLILRFLFIFSLVLNAWLGYYLFIHQPQKQANKPPHNISPITKDPLSLPTKKITNPLVIIVGCIKYNIKDKADLPGTKTELKKIKELFEKNYGYKVNSTYIEGVSETEELGKKDILKFCDEQVALLKQPNNPHDGILFIYSGHGQDGTILDSSGRALSIYKIKSKFDADNLPEMAGMPKICLFSKCRGQGIIEPVVYKGHSYHPEGDFFDIYGNIPNYQIADNPPEGAYLINSFYNKLLEKPALCLSDILRHISNDVQRDSQHKELVVQHINTNYKIYLAPNNSTDEKKSK